jgi:hypothetical protein
MVTCDRDPNPYQNPKLEFGNDGWGCDHLGGSDLKSERGQSKVWIEQNRISLSMNVSTSRRGWIMYVLVLSGVSTSTEEYVPLVLR